jgi:hypothetical protein
MMGPSFSDIPTVVIDYVRDVFAGANDKVSRTVAMHPSMHEETLDHILVMELSASPPAFFATEQIGLTIESHWLGSRWMWGRWEIADIAFFVILRSRGRLVTRKVALLQTKRLYSKEIPVVELHEDDYRIGIGRLVDRTDPSVTTTKQRKFSFDSTCVYGALRAGDPQIVRIGQYIADRGIPVYYGLYHPLVLPCSRLYPELNGALPLEPNKIGCRIQQYSDVERNVGYLNEGEAPTFSKLTLAGPIDPMDASSLCGTIYCE